MKFSQQVFDIKDPGPGEVEGWVVICSAPCGFTSSGWHTEGQAKERADQHGHEHVTGAAVQRGQAEEATLMQPIEEFIADRQTGPGGRGVVRSASKEG